MAPENVPVHVECSIMINVTTSATKAELGGLFENCQKATSMRTALAEMGHLQPTTPVAMENTETSCIVNGMAKQKISRSIDMRFYWVRDRIQKQFPHILRKGEEKSGRCVTEHHPIWNHREIRPIYVKEKKKKYITKKTG